MKKQSLTLSVVQWRRLTQEGVYIPVRIQLNGSSMQPLIRRERDYVTIHPIHRPLKRGDIVLFADNTGRYVVHRVWKLDEHSVITLGDNCECPDVPLEHSQVWGLVVKLERGSHVIRLDTPGARTCGRLWMSILPLRRLCRRSLRMAKRIYRKLKGK